jgi:hypothetical protein
MSDNDAKRLWLQKLADQAGGPAPIAATAAPGGAPGGAPGAPPPTRPPAQTPDFKAPVANPFDAPEAIIEFDRLTLTTIQNMAVQQAQNARNDFEAALNKVKAAKKAQADAEQARRDLMWTIAITVALMPAGPIVEAAGTAVAGPALQKKMMETLANNAGAIEARFAAKGAAAVNKTFDFVAGDAVTKLAAKFDAAKAKGALDAGVGALRGKAIQFAASSDKGTCVANYLDAMLKSANDAMHNLTDVILTTKSYSEALAFYTFFSKPLQAIYEAVLGQQADDMLSEVAGALAETAGGTASKVAGVLGVGKTQEIVKINAYGRLLFCHIETYAKADAISDTYDFVKWVTPDMEPMAEKLAKRTIQTSDISNHIPDPQREPGERVVLVDGWGKERVVLIGIEDQGIYWKDYGVRTFKRWAESAEDDKALRSRAAMQIGGLDKVEVGSIQGIKPPAA